MKTIIIAVLILVGGVGFVVWSVRQAVHSAVVQAEKPRVIQDSSGVAGHRASEEDLMGQVQGMVERVTKPAVVYRFAYGPSEARPQGYVAPPDRELITTFAVGVKPQGGDDKDGTCVSVTRIPGESMDSFLARVESELKRRLNESPELTRSGYRTCDPR